MRNLRSALKQNFQLLLTGLFDLLMHLGLDFIKNVFLQLKIKLITY